MKSAAADTLANAMDEVIARNGGETVIVGDRGAHSYADLDRVSRALAATLMADGVRKGDHVGVWMPTGFAFLAIFCAAARVGAVVVPVNTRYQRDEVAHVLSKGAVRVLFAQRRMWRTDAWATLCTLAPEVDRAASDPIDSPALPALRTVVLTGEVDDTNAAGFDAYVKRGANGPTPQWPDVAEQDRLLICFTSGSTGRPKGVVHTHRVLRHCRRLAEIQGLQPGERSLANWPLHHAGGLFLLMLPTLLSGATLVEIDQWSGEAALRLIEAHQVTVLGGIPTHYLDMIDHPEVATRDLSSLRYCYMGGANVARDLFDRIVATLRIDTLPSTYGLTENTVSTTFNLPGDTADQCSRNIAPVIAACEVRVVDAESGLPVPQGEQGEIQFRGRTVMAGYHDDPDATRATITPDGWLRTGDLGLIHANGYLQPTGRLKEMLKVGGSNVAPLEVESVLDEHPAIRNAVVVGVPDARLTEVAYAFAELRPGMSAEASELIAHCRSQIADYKVPRYIKLLGELPRLSTGKIDRAALSKAARESVELQ